MIAGIDIGGTKIAIGLVDNGVVLVRENIPVQAQSGATSAGKRLQEVLRRQLAETCTVLTGIGIACTGPVDPVRGELGDVNTLPGWQGWNPVRELSDVFGVPAAMENDADAAALGEARWGAGKGRHSLVCITVGTGIGAGIILNGEVYRGLSDAHPEIGHHIVEPDGPLCTCGASGCWETFASGPALEQWYAEQNPDKGRLSGKDISVLARTGDAGARQAIERLAEYLGIGLSNVVSILMPELIVLSGSVMQSADILMDRVREVVRRNCRMVPVENCEITLSHLGADAGLIGAAEVWHNRFDH